MRAFAISSVKAVMLVQRWVTSGAVGWSSRSQECPCSERIRRRDRRNARKPQFLDQTVLQRAESPFHTLNVDIICANSSQAKGR
jgi:hypothetical protein